MNPVQRCQPLLGVLRDPAHMGTLALAEWDMLLRQAAGHAWFFDCIRLLAHPVGTMAWWFLGLCSAVWGLWQSTALPLQVWGAASVFGILGVMLVKRGVRRGALSIFMWHYWALSIVIGLTLSGRSPAEPIAGVELSGKGNSP